MRHSRVSRYRQARSPDTGDVSVPWRDDCGIEYGFGFPVMLESVQEEDFRGAFEDGAFDSGVAEFFRVSRG